MFFQIGDCLAGAVIGAVTALLVRIIIATATRRARGNADQMRIPTACCDNTFRREPTCRCTRRRSSIEWLGSSMNGRVRLWDLKPRPNDLMLVLHRSLEPAGVKRTTRINRLMSAY
jgi:hypothetical protein